MKCPNCGADIPDDAKFCSACGKSLQEYGSTDTDSAENAAGGKESVTGNSMASFAAPINEAKARFESVRGAIENDRKVEAKAFPDSYLYELFHTKKLGTQLAVWSTLFLYMCFVADFPSEMFEFFFNVMALILCVAAFVLGKNEHGDRSHLLTFNIILAIIIFFKRGG